KAALLGTNKDILMCDGHRRPRVLSRYKPLDPHDVRSTVRRTQSASAARVTSQNRELCSAQREALACP
uniref:Uncharacterized protein n=1 Tax=Aegilops tauschii subsp. strangulata TaxID=200361 RepID=A0A453T908_AEGTS